jgi:T4-like virus tail tube protein gp19
MPFNVNEFRTNMPYDGARPNLFDCSVVFPGPVEGAGAGGLGNATEFTFKCRAASIPGSTIGTVIAPYFGREIKLAGNRTFEDWTVTVMMDEDYEIRHAFEDWMGKINTHITNLRDAEMLNPFQYQADIHLRHYSKAGEMGASVLDEDATIAKYIIVGAFPISVEPVQLDWAANDQLAEFSVTFAYQWWQTATLESTTAGA